MSAATATIIGGIGAAAAAGATVYGANKSANAATAAGQAQASAAQNSLDFQKSVYADNKKQQADFMAQAAQYAQPTVSDIKALNQMATVADAQNQSALTQIQQGQAVLNSINPALKAAGDQALQLINGQASAVLKPLQDQRATQRSQLENQLAEKFGASFRYSAAGIKALNDFDTQTANSLYTAQTGAINTVVNAASGLSNISAQTQANMQNQVGTAQNASNSVLNANDALSKREQQPFYIGAQFNPSASGVGNAAQIATQAAGNPFAGGIAMGQSIQNVAGAVGQSALTYALGNPSSPAATYTPTGSSSTGVGFSVPNIGSGTLPQAPAYNIGDLGSFNGPNPYSK